MYSYTFDFQNLKEIKFGFLSVQDKKVEIEPEMTEEFEETSL